MHPRISKGKKYVFLFVSDERYERTGLLTQSDPWAFIAEESREIREWLTTNAAKGRYRFEVQKSWFSGDIHRKQYRVWLADASVAVAFKIRWC